MSSKRLHNSFHQNTIILFITIEIVVVDIVYSLNTKWPVVTLNDYDTIRREKLT